MSTPRLRFAAFTRVSTESQAEKGSSLTIQKEKILAAAKKHGAVVHWYGGTAEHGTPGYEKLEFNRLLHDCAGKRKFDAIIVAEFSRFTRDARALLDAFDVFKANKIEFWERDRKHEVGDDVNVWLSLMVQGVFNQGTVRRQAQSGNDTRIQRARRGFPSSGSGPWGRICTNAKEAANADAIAVWSVDKRVQKYAEKIAKWRTQDGMTWEAIAERLSKDEAYRAIHWLGMNVHKKRIGKKLPEISHFANFLRRNMRQRTGDRYAQTFTERGEKVVVVTSVPALLPSAAIAAMDKDAATRIAGKAPKHEYLLSRICRCGGCGSVLVGHTHLRSSDGKLYKKPICYFSHHTKAPMTPNCVKRIRVEDIQVPVMEELSRRLADVDGLVEAITDAVVGAKGELVDAKAEAVTVAKRLGALNAAIDEHVSGAGTAKRGGSVAEQSWLKIAARHEAEHGELTRRQAELEEKIRSLDAPADLRQQVDRMVQAIKKPGRVAFLAWPYAAQYQLVRWLFDAHGSIKYRDDVGVWISPLRRKDKLPSFRWNAKGLFGDLTGALGYSNEGVENYADGGTWQVGAEHVRRLAQLATDFNLEPLKSKTKKGGNGGGGGSRDSARSAGLQTSSHADRRWFASRYRGTALRTPAAGFAHRVMVSSTLLD